MPMSMVRKILHSNHDLPHAGHQGFDKTLQLIKRKFVWKGMATDVKNYCAKCLSCAKRKTSPHLKPAPLQELPETLSPFERVSMDIVGPLQTSKHGNKYLLTFQDAYSSLLKIVMFGYIALFGTY